MIDTAIWNELVLEVLIAARKGISVRDFEVQCRLTPMENGKSFFDRIRVAENLQNNQMIEVEDGYLRLSAKNIPDSLIDDLKIGSEVAWDILDCIDPSKKLLPKIDLELLHKIGLDGELAVIDALKKNIPQSEIQRIRHVSLVDDSAGFDIHAPSVKNFESTILLEVKTSPRPGPDFTFFISRNEARVAQHNNNWFLLAVISTPYGYQVLGTLTFYQFSEYLPLNQDKRGQWESAKISIPRELFKKGLP
jgi:hypothetical protein